MWLEFKIFHEDDNPTWDFDNIDESEFTELTRKIKFKKTDKFGISRLGYSGFTITQGKNVWYVLGEDIYLIDRSSYYYAQDTEKEIETWLKIYVELREPILFKLID